MKVALVGDLAHTTPDAITPHSPGSSYHPTETRGGVCQAVHGATGPPVQPTAAGLEGEGPPAGGRAPEDQTGTDKVPDPGRSPHPH